MLMIELMSVVDGRVVPFVCVSVGLDAHSLEDAEVRPINLHL